MSKEKDEQGKGCSTKKMCKEKDMQGKGCARKRMSKKKDEQGKECAWRRMCMEKDVHGKGCATKGNFNPDKRIPGKLISSEKFKARGVCRRQLGAMALKGDGS